MPGIYRSIYDHQNASLLFGCHGQNMLKSVKDLKTLRFTKTLTSTSNYMTHFVGKFEMEKCGVYTSRDVIR